MTQDVILDLSMATGTGTQRYSEDIIALSIIDAYFLLSGEQWWKRQMRWQSRDLDGVTGIVTAPLPYANFGDIERVLRGREVRPLPTLPMEFNPYSIAGTTARYVEDYDDSANGDRLFRIWPLEAADTVRVYGRVLTVREDIGPDTRLNFDEYALRMFAAWKQSETDAASPGQAAMFQGMLERKMRQLRATETAMSLELDPRRFEETTEWQEMP